MFRVITNTMVDCTRHLKILCARNKLNNESQNTWPHNNNNTLLNYELTAVTCLLLRESPRLAILKTHAANLDKYFTTETVSLPPPSKKRKKNPMIC